MNDCYGITKRKNFILNDLKIKSMPFKCQNQKNLNVSIRSYRSDNLRLDTKILCNEMRTQRHFERDECIKVFNWFI